MYTIGEKIKINIKGSMFDGLVGIIIGIADIGVTDKTFYTIDLGYIKTSINEDNIERYEVI